MEVKVRNIVLYSIPPAKTLKIYIFRISIIQSMNGEIETFINTKLKYI
jgi:hypothetical protein